MLDEAIRFCNETAADYMGEAMQYDECDEWEWVNKCINEERAANYKQIAEWLTELQQWRRVFGVCPSYEMCIPECKEGYDA